jgi:hypothetical protein
MQLKKKKQEGHRKPKSVFAQWNPLIFQEIKKTLSIEIHMSMLCKSSLQDYESLSLIIQTPHATMVVMSRDRFLLVRTMLHLNTNDIKAARGQPDI